MQTDKQAATDSAEVLAMLQEAMLKQQQAQELRGRPVLSGATGGFATARRNYKANQNEEQSLSVLRDAFQKQQGVEFYQKQVERMMQLAEEQREAQEKRDYYQFEQQNKVQDPTAIMKEAEAMGLEPGTPEYNDFLRQTRTRSHTSYNITPPKDHVFKDPRNPAAGFEVIPGSPTAREIDTAKEKKAGQREMKATAATTVTQDLGRALQLLGETVPGDNTFGAIGRMVMSRTPHQPEYNIRSFVESAKSNIGLDRLQQMRENSPTGGALGQVPFQQQKRLEQVYGEVDFGQPVETMEHNIKRIMNIYFDAIHGSKGERDRAVEQGLISPEQNAEIDRLYYELPFNVRGEPETPETNSQDSAYEQWKRENGIK